MADLERLKEEIMMEVEQANEYTDAAEDLYAQFNFKKAKEYFEKGAEMFINLKKKTKDDKKFSKKMKKRAEEALTRAET